MEPEPEGKADTCTQYETRPREKMCYARKEKRLMAFGCFMHESRKAQHCAIMCVLSGYERTRTLYATKTHGSF